MDDHDRVVMKEVLQRDFEEVETGQFIYTAPGVPEILQPYINRELLDSLVEKLKK